MQVSFDTAVLSSERASVTRGGVRATIFILSVRRVGGEGMVGGGGGGGGGGRSEHGGVGTSGLLTLAAVLARPRLAPRPTGHRPLSWRTDH